MSRNARHALSTRQPNTSNQCYQEMYQKPPWQDLAADFFNFKGKEYLLVADTFSKYPFASRMTTKTAETVTQKFTQLFSQYGNPKSLTTDKWTTILLRSFHSVYEYTESRTYHFLTTLPEV